MNEHLKLQMTKIIKAKREKVFAAWTDPKFLKQWFGPGALIVPKVQVDLRVGGSYKVDFEGEMRNQQTKGSVSGIYKKIIPNELLIFTFKGTWQQDTPETLVTVILRDTKDGTEIALTQENIANAQENEGYEHGWGSSLEKLAQFFSRESLKV